MRILALLLVLIASSVIAEPQQSLPYKRDVIRYSRVVWGMEAPIPLFAAQIHQESMWRPKAKSAYAAGLTQFTPDTAEWIVKVFPELGKADVFNPTWAIQAMVRYDLWLYNRNQGASICDRMAFVLSAYNGGLGWTQRDRKLAAAAGKDPNRWWGHVEGYSKRAPQFIKENRDYPKKIIYQHQKQYLSWTGAPVCIGGTM